MRNVAQPQSYSEPCDVTPSSGPKRSEATMPEEKEFQCIPRGAGGTFHIEIGNGLRFGTLGCRESLGVHFRIDEKPVFCAHMTVDMTSSSISEEHGQFVRGEVYNRLVKVAEKENWSVEHPNFSEEVLLLCRYPMQTRNDHLVKGEGGYMASGVRLLLLYWAVARIAITCKARPCPSAGAEFFQNPPKFPELSEYEEESGRLCRQAVLISARAAGLETNDEGRGFIVEQSPKLELCVIERDEQDGLNFRTGKPNKSIWLPQHEGGRLGNWCFSLDPRHQHRER